MAETTSTKTKEQTLFTTNTKATMQIGIPKENPQNSKESIDETRVSATPTSVSEFIKLGFEVIIAKGAGAKSGFSDEE